MKDQKVREQFIELRSQGWSFDKIANELGTSKPVLIGWSREFSLEIENLKSIALDGLREKYVLTVQKRLELLGELLEKLKAEALSRNFSKMADHRILEMIIRYTEIVHEMTPPVQFKIKEKHNAMDELIKNIESRETVVSWKA